MHQKNELKRTISLPLLVFYTIGNILGAGIYVLIGKISHYAGIYTPLSFIFAAIIVIFTAFSYMELSARFPKSAGGALYVHMGFKTQWLTNIVGAIIFASGIFSAATLLKGFYGYFSTFSTLSAPVIYITLITIMTTIAIIGINQSVKTAIFFTFAELFGLLLVIYGGFSYIEPDMLYHSFDITEIDRHTFYMILIGAFLAFYAYIGFEDIVNLAEEIKDPQTTIPKAILIAITVTTLLYILISIISIAVLGVEKLSRSQAPLAEVYEATIGTDSSILRVIGMMAIINGVLIQILMVSRLLYGMAREKWLPEFLTYVHPTTHTPMISTLLSASIILVLVLFFPIETLAKSTSTFIFILFILINLSLIRIKLKDPSPDSIRVYPLWIPIAGTLLNVIMLLFQMVYSINSAH